MKIKRATREKFAAIYVGLLCLGLTSMMVAVTIKAYNDSTIDLKKVDVYEGIVTDTGIGWKQNPKMDVKVFYFRMNGLDDLLASYNMHGDYATLQANVNRGDSIKIYFKESGSDDYNLDVIQIEKGGEIILDKSKFEKQQTALIYIGAVGGLLMFGTFGWLIVRWRKVFNTTMPAQSTKIQ